MTLYSSLAHVALAEFSDVVTSCELIHRRASVPLKLCLFIRDGTLIDIWLSADQVRYAYHKAQTRITG